METVKTTTIKHLVTEDYRAAAVFEKYSIDFCCNGGKSLDAACAERGLDVATVLGELQELKRSGPGAGIRPAEWELDMLADFIVNNHHHYVSHALPVILPHVFKVLSVHGANHSELQPIADRFREVARELTHHMQKEEMVLFPYIKALVVGGREGRAMNAPPFGTIRNPIRMMESEHVSAGDAMSFIRDASKGYTPPPDACTTTRVTYKELEEFERDLHQHIHLENNILFPKAIELEERLLARV